MIAKNSGSNSLEEELTRISIIEQRFAEESKSKTFYERQRRLIEANFEYNKSFLSNLPCLQAENLLKTMQNSGGSSEQGTTKIQPNPKWKQAWEQKMTEDAMNVG